jgi:putative ABC transport system permease protein
VLSEFRLALRSFARTPGYAGVIVLTLALGIGANTAIFSFFNAILFRPLPFSSPETIVVVKKKAQDYSEPMGNDVGLLAADFRELQPAVRSLSEMATYTLEAPTMSGRGLPDIAIGTVVSQNFFSLLGTTAARGRVFTPEDAAGGGGGRLVTVSHKYWQTRLGGDPQIVGQTLLLNKVPFTIVGVMPADFEFPHDAQFWATPAGPVPENSIGNVPANYGGRGNYIRTIIGRLQHGVGIAQAEQELAALVARLPNPNLIQRSVHLLTMRDQVVGNVRWTLVLLLGGVGLVLLIACFNVANLMLSRATARQREIGIRLALGSSRWRIARQMLSESLVLSLFGGIVGVLLSIKALALLVQFAPEGIPRLAAVDLDATVLGFALLISIGTGLVSGLAPVFGTMRADFVTLIKSGGDRGGSAGAAPKLLRNGLVAGEVAITLMLLVAAGLLLRSLEKISATPWGFRPEQVVSARVTFMEERYGQPAAQRQFFRALSEKLGAVPGFESAGISFDRIGQSWLIYPFLPEGHDYANPADMPQASYHIISPSYLATMGVVLQQGRFFTLQDDETTDPVVIIDEALAKRFFPERQAVGKRIGLRRQSGIVWAQVVGVVSVVKSDGPAALPRPELYLPYLQEPFNSFYLHARTTMGVAAAGARFAEVLQQVDAGVPMAHLENMEQVISKAGAGNRFPLGISGGFAVFALLLAGLGIYAVTAYGVAQRTREIGVRMALGATPSSVVSLVLRQGFGPIGVGLVIGLIGSVIEALVMRNLLFGVEPLDLPTFVVIPLVLVGFALLACWLPARKAARVNPLEALRTE